MKAHKVILERVGTTLILLGVTQVYLGIWKLFYTTPQNALESYSFLVIQFLLIAIVWGVLFFVTPGILLFRGGLKTAKYLRHLALFSLAACACGGLLMPFLQPLGYYYTLLNLSPLSLLSEWWGTFVYLAFFYCLQDLLGRPAIMDAQVDARITPASTRLPLWIGSACALITLAALYCSLHGSSSDKAIQRVKAKYGTRYDYFVNSLHWNLGESATSINARVIGYNAREIQTFTVHWVESSPAQVN
jgi:hypothetical protein